MTYHLRIRHGSTSMLAEYECATHGRFAATVMRDELRDPPPSQPCPDCSATSDHCISSIPGRLKRGEVARGKSDERPPNALNTEPLADGMPYDEWSKGVEKQAFDERRKIVRDKMGIT